MKLPLKIARDNKTIRSAAGDRQSHTFLLKSQILSGEIIQSSCLVYLRE